MTQAPFYASGLKFSCKRCSSCCRYSPGYVFLSKKDLGLLAKELKMDNTGFAKTYCRWVPQPGSERLSLKEKSNFDCILWDQGCTVYNARPAQCRTFPFWKTVVASSLAWETAAYGCPGINSGKLHSSGAIIECIKLREKQPPIEKQTAREI